MPVFIDAAGVAAALPFPRLVAGLRAAFAAGAEVPLRHHHPLPGGGSLLLMPAWTLPGQGRPALGVKIVTVFPGNAARGLNAVGATYVLCDGETGMPLAVMDGGELTARRTAAASALAGDHLARPDAARLLILGSGHVAAMLAPAWAAVRALRHVAVWNHRPEGAARLAARLRAQGFPATPAENLPEAVAAADIVSCATLAAAPLVAGAWLRPGVHLDLIGGFRPDMREADDDAIRRARVFLDTEAAAVEAGDITQPLASGALRRDGIAGTLADLCRGAAPGRVDPAEITVFKSVGTALEDLAAAALVYNAADMNAEDPP